MITGFEIFPEEAAKLHEWWIKHDCRLKNHQGAIGGRMTYCFTPTSLGVVTKCVCACGEEIDVTDYENW